MVVGAGKVQLVTSFPDRCGKWQIVESFPDLKVQVVESELEDTAGVFELYSRPIDGSGSPTKLNTPLAAGHNVLELAAEGGFADPRRGNRLVSPCISDGAGAHCRTGRRLGPTDLLAVRARGGLPVLVSIIAQQCQLSAMNPYIKPWSIEARRIPAPAALGSGYINGDANPALTYQVGGAGLVNGDTLSGGLATSATTASNVGTYGITQGTLASHGSDLLIRGLRYLCASGAAGSTCGRMWARGENTMGRAKIPADCCGFRPDLAITV